MNNPRRQASFVIKVESLGMHDASHELIMALATNTPPYTEKQSFTLPYNARDVFLLLLQLRDSHDSLSITP